MYAIIEDSGQQYKVAPGDRIFVDLRDLPEGADTIEFDKVLAVGEGPAAKIGQPYVAGAKVIGKLTRDEEGPVEVKGEKVITVHFRRRKNYKKKIGHRQRYLQVTVSDILG